MRKIGLLRVSKGDSTTGEFDSREDLKQPEPQEEPDQQQEQQTDAQQAPDDQIQDSPEEPKQQF